MRKAQFAAVIALSLFSLMGGCLILAQGGFTTSSKRGHWSVFIPPPQAYVMAAIMFTISILGVLWLLQEQRASRLVKLMVSVGYGATAFALTSAMANHLN